MRNNSRKQFKKSENLVEESASIQPSESVTDLHPSIPPMTCGTYIPVNISIVSNSIGKNNLAEDLLFSKLNEFKMFLKERHKIDFIYKKIGGEGNDSEF